MNRAEAWSFIRRERRSVSPRSAPRPQPLSRKGERGARCAERCRHRPDGTLYASDPSWGKSTGHLWRIDTKGKVTRLASDMGTTNGIDVSPDGKTLYVNESVPRNVWAFPISGDGSLGEKKLLKKFPDHGFDGMRCAAEGNLYITRHGKGTVVKMSPTGEILQEIDVLGKNPTNLCFGGPDGRTVYVTEEEKRRLVSFRVDKPGLAWQRWQEAKQTTSDRRDPKGSAGEMLCDCMTFRPRSASRRG